MASNIDTSFIGAGNVPKAGMITALETAKAEITALQNGQTMSAGGIQGLLFNPFQEINQQFGINVDTPVPNTAVATYVSDMFYAQCSTSALSLSARTLQFSDFDAFACFTHGTEISTGGTGTVTAAADYIIPFATCVEGTYWRQLRWGGGTAARGITLIMIVSAPKAGAYALSVRRGGGSIRSYVTMVNIPTPNTNTVVLVNIPGDQTIGWSTDNTTAVMISFGALSGTDRHTHTLNAWIGGDALSHSSAVQWGETVGARFRVRYINVWPEGVVPFTSAAQITGPSLQSLANVRRGYASDVELCRRYYFVNNRLYRGQGYGANINHNIFIPVDFPVAMRKEPSITLGARAGETNISAVNVIDGHSTGFNIQVIGNAASVFATTVNGYSANARMLPVSPY